MYYFVLLSFGHFSLVLSCAYLKNKSLQLLSQTFGEAKFAKHIQGLQRGIQAFLVQHVDVAVAQHFFLPATGQWAAPSSTGVCRWYSEVAQIVGEENLKISTSERVSSESKF